MTVPGMPSWALPDKPPPPPAPVGMPDPPTIQTLPDGSRVVYPMVWAEAWGQGYAPPGGGPWDDGTQINQAFQQLPTVTDPETGAVIQVGTVRLHPAATYQVFSTLVKPAFATLDGGGSARLNINGPAATGIYSHATAPPAGGQVQHSTKCGRISGLIVDGTGTTGAAVGIDVGDGWGHLLGHLRVQNFTGAGAIGLNVANRNFWTEKFRALAVTVQNCSLCIMHQATAAANSQEYQDCEYYIWAVNGQSGLAWQGVKWNGRMLLQGNIGTSAAAGPYITGLFSAGGSGPSIVDGQFCISVETNAMQNPGPNNPYGMFFNDAVCTFGQASGAQGFLRFVQGQSNPAVGQFAFRGIISEGATGNPLQAITTPAVPASTVAAVNNQNDCMVYITGGTVTQVRVNTQITGLLPPCSVFVPAGGSVSVTYSAAPSWLWSGVI